MASQVELVCMVNLSHRRWVDAIYRGKKYPAYYGRPVEEWFDAMGRRCEQCRPKVEVHANGHDTEYAAARAMAPSAESMRLLAIRALEAHPDGLTDDEGGALIGGDRLDFGRRRHELVKAGLVEDSGRRRPSDRGHPAIVWIRKWT